MAAVARHVFVTGGTGYIGSALIPRLLARGHRVAALARTGSNKKLPPGCDGVAGNALDGASYASRVGPADTFVHLVGVAHPNPSKAEEFRSVDLVSLREAVRTAEQAGIAHFIYVSVAQPAPVMKAYVEVRAECEALVRDSGLRATILRPWYVLGPGHRWPYLLLPGYWLAVAFPPTRETARRLGLVKLNQMLVALVDAVEDPSDSIRILEVPHIRRLSRAV